MSDREFQERDLDAQKLPLKLVVVILGCTISLTIAGAGLANAIRNDISGLKKDILPREELIEWRDRLADDNIALKVPRISRSSPKQNQ